MFLLTSITRIWFCIVSDLVNFMSSTFVLCSSGSELPAGRGGPCGPSPSSRGLTYNGYHLPNDISWTRAMADLARLKRPPSKSSQFVRLKNVIQAPIASSRVTAAASLWGRKSLDSWFNKSGYGLYNGRWSSIRANKYDFIMEPNAKLGHVRSEARLWSGHMCAGICGDTGGAGASVATGSQGGDKLIDSWRNNGTSSLFHRHCLTPGWLAAAAAWCAA